MISVAGNIRAVIGRLIVAHPDGDFVRMVCRYFARLGWRVDPASSGTAARRLARAAAPSVVVLATHNREESGWLTCAKLTGELPGQKVVLIGNDPRPGGRRLSKFVGGAAFVPQRAGIDALIDQVHAAAREKDASQGPSVSQR